MQSVSVVYSFRVSIFFFNKKKRTKKFNETEAVRMSISSFLMHVACV